MLKNFLSISKLFFLIGIRLLHLGKSTNKSIELLGPMKEKSAFGYFFLIFSKLGVTITASPSQVGSSIKIFTIPLKAC